MKKKLVEAIILTLIVAILGGQSFAFADEPMPCYNVVSQVVATISSGTDSIISRVHVGAPNSSSLDKVYVEVQLKKASGAVVATYKKYMDKSTENFLFEEATTVKSKGTYLFSYTLTCYKDNKVVDTITGNSRSLVYEP